MSNLIPPWSSNEWDCYFRTNNKRLLSVDWSHGGQLASIERRAIQRSLQEFQLGESSEGAHLLRQAKAYAERAGDAYYVSAIRLFMAEEHRHARDLGRFMEMAGIAKIDHTWVDSVFRFLRRAAGLELSIMILLTAEVIARVYYDALLHATGSPVLRRICAQVLSDEAEHVRFHAERLAIIRRHRLRVVNSIVVAFHRMFMVITCLVVWRGHRLALRAGGFGFLRFLRAVWAYMNDAFLQMDPSMYLATHDCIVHLHPKTRNTPS